MDFCLKYGNITLKFDHTYIYFFYKLNSFFCNSKKRISSAHVNSRTIVINKSKESFATEPKKKYIICPTLVGGCLPLVARRGEIRFLVSCGSVLTGCKEGSTQLLIGRVEGGGGGG